MTQYDAGPGDWSDREWEAPDRKPEPHVKRRRVTLPPWALLSGLVAIVILLCAGLVIVVRAIRGGGAEATETPAAVVEGETAPTETAALSAAPTEPLSPTATVVITDVPITDVLPTAPVEIAIGAKVVVQNTKGAGLNLRAEPSTAGAVVVTVNEGAVLSVIAGPEEGNGFTWWQVRTADGKEGWGAKDWLMLKTD